MSAESPIRSQSRTNVNNSVLPQQVTDPTILDSVAGFINDVVPTAYNLPTDTKDHIQWARFETIDTDDYNNCTNNFDCDKILPPPILLVLAYTTGIQVWAIPANGEATEILSWRHGSVRALRILPSPHKIGQKSNDPYAEKRPLIALCDNVAPGTDYCSLSFISLKTGEQVKLIKFKNPILDVAANKRSVVVTFTERIAVFDSFTLEDRLTVTTCYLSPGIYPNPIALGSRWLAYAENKLIPSRRSSGGNDGEGVQSYTATVLHAAKSLGRGLRELGETVASSLTGNPQHKPGLSLGSTQSSGHNDVQQKGVVTILDIESPHIDNAEKIIQTESIVAHFTAHKEAIVYLCFDPSGMLLLTADKRAYDFHLFRIHPHPGGPSLASVHHLYILHRGDTTARVQDISFSPDSRWVTVSTLRGTTHVFPITPYGGNVGVRTHATPHVVNKMSRFHRSAGLTAEGRSNSPVSIFEAPVNSNLPYHNPRLPPYPHPTVVHPLAQIRQPLFLQNATNQNRANMSRQRLGSSEDNMHVTLRVCACFAPARAWIESPTQLREPAVTKTQVKPVESLFIMSLHGSLIQYDLEPHHAASVPKEKICDDTLIELTVSAKAQWVLQRQSCGKDIQLPLPTDYLNYIYKEELLYKNTKPDHTDDRWLSQVEIVTHAGPHRRLWMGPQFSFKTYNNGTGTSINILDSQAIEMVRSKPVNMPLSAAYPILIEAGSVSSCEPSPKLLDTLQRNFDDAGGAGELQLREDLADAMLESPGIRETGGRCVIVSMKPHNTCLAKVVNPLGMVVTVQSDEESELEVTEEIIHENCDEALFRPVVASKAVLFAEPKNIKTKVAPNVLHVNQNVYKSDDNNKLLSRKEVHDKINKTEITYKSNEPKTKAVTKVAAKKNKNEPAKGINDIENELKINKTKVKEMKHSEKAKKENNKLTAKNIINDDNEQENVFTRASEDYFQDAINEINKAPKTETTSGINIIQKVDSIENLDLISHFEKKEATVELLQDSFFDANEACDDIFSLDKNYAKESENPKLEESASATKIDVFEGDLPMDKVDDKLKSMKVDKESSSEENVEEKKVFARPRKVKTKLGVRIGKTIETEKVDEIESAPRLWSSIAANKVTSPKSESILDLPEIESVQFNIDLPKMNYSKALKDFAFETNKIDADVTHPEKVCKSSDVFIEDLLKIDKSSDDEKAETNSSQTETTESDDSSKIPPAIIMDTEDDAQVETKSKLSTNKNKKSKKKRR